MENIIKLKIIKTVLNVGAEKPFKVLHITDSHITRGDVYRGRRTKTFNLDFENCAEEYFFAAMRYAFEEALTESLVQYTTHGSFAGFVREITVL